MLSTSLHKISRDLTAKRRLKSVIKTFKNNHFKTYGTMITAAMLRMSDLLCCASKHLNGVGVCGSRSNESAVHAAV